MLVCHGRVLLIRSCRYWTAESGLVTEVDADAMEVEAKDVE